MVVKELGWVAVAPISPIREGREHPACLSYESCPVNQIKSIPKIDLKEGFS